MKKIEALDLFNSMQAETGRSRDALAEMQNYVPGTDMYKAYLTMYETSALRLETLTKQFREWLEN